jgi:endonuclease YncB( thermonuclease family)
MMDIEPDKLLETYRTWSLMDGEASSLEMFMWRGWYIAEFCDFYDGDTASVVFRNWNSSGTDLSGFVKLRARFYGLDTPEMKQPRSLPVEEREKNKAAAKAAKARAQELLAGKHLIHMVEDRSGKTTGKFGRILIDVALLGDDVAGSLRDAANGKITWFRDVMIAEGHALPYYGGKK